jgi:hypothetical protein
VSGLHFEMQTWPSGESAKVALSIHDEQAYPGSMNVMIWPAQQRSELLNHLLAG